MAHKTFCDRCGNEIKPRQLFSHSHKKYDTMLSCTFQRFGLCQKRWELCYDCAKAVRAFLNSPDLTDVTGDEEYNENEDE